MSGKVDLKKQLAEFYNPSSKSFSIVTVPPMRFLMIDGAGNPNTSPAFKEATEALYGLSYPLKFAVRKQQGIDYGVMPLEGLWWAEDMAAYTTLDKDSWQWTLMIMQPEYVSEALVEQIRDEVARKKALPALSRVRFETYDEGLSVQIMHIGPYDAEAPTIARMHDYIMEQGYALRGKHHEIYLSDPNRTAPEKLKTILRQPVATTS
ncbi:MAG: GyrI-like domain-containing protein [Chloroflexota bacterium]|nr:MAG: hypothetical protein DIU68_00640 [Chloroflexota bacterium]